MFFFRFTTGIALGFAGGIFVAQNYNIPPIKPLIFQTFNLAKMMEKNLRKDYDVVMERDVEEETERGDDATLEKDSWWSSRK